MSEVPRQQEDVGRTTKHAGSAKTTMTDVPRAASPLRGSASSASRLPMAKPSKPAVSSTMPVNAASILQEALAVDQSGFKSAGSAAAASTASKLRGAMRDSSDVGNRSGTSSMSNSPPPIPSKVLKKNPSSDTKGLPKASSAEPMKKPVPPKTEFPAPAAPSGAAAVLNDVKEPVGSPPPPPDVLAMTGRSSMEIESPEDMMRRLLSEYRLLGGSGLRVSPLCLGTMTFGNVWQFTGKVTQTDAERILDRFVELGGNFIDTANKYHDGQTEEWIGEYMEKRGNRERVSGFLFQISQHIYFSLSLPQSIPCQPKPA